MYKLILVALSCCWALTSHAITVTLDESSLSKFNNSKEIFDTPKESNGAYPEYPIIGNWNYQVPSTNCIETYQFQPDGTLRGTSAKQVVDSTYTISKKHTQYAFYELKHQIITSNMEKDCDEEVSEVGLSVTNFIRYDTTGDLMLICADENALLNNCFGPLIRKK